MPLAGFLGTPQLPTWKYAHFPQHAPSPPVNTPEAEVLLNEQVAAANTAAAYGGTDAAVRLQVGVVAAQHVQLARLQRKSANRTHPRHLQY